MEQQFITIEAAVLAIIGLVVYFFMSRWVFLVKKRVRIQQAHLYITLQAAKMQGVPDRDLQNAAEIADGLIDIDFAEIYPKKDK